MILHFTYKKSSIEIYHHYNYYYELVTFILKELFSEQTSFFILLSFPPTIQVVASELLDWGHGLLLLMVQPLGKSLLTVVHEISQRLSVKCTQNHLIYAHLYII